MKVNCFVSHTVVFSYSMSRLSCSSMKKPCTLYNGNFEILWNSVFVLYRNTKDIFLIRERGGDKQPFLEFFKHYNLRFEYSICPVWMIVHVCPLTCGHKVRSR